LTDLFPVLAGRGPQRDPHPDGLLRESALSG
jgi:hypothetical protein